MPQGRPATYTTEIADVICDELATNRRSLKAICESNLFPDVATIWRWLRKYPDFWEKYTKARDFQTELMYDDMEDIINAPLVDAWGNPLEGGAAMAEIQRRKLAVDTMKFKLAKLQPKRFGDNRNITIDVPVRKITTPDAIVQLRQELMKQLKKPDIEDIEHEDVE